MLTSLDDNVAVGLRSYPDDGGCGVNVAPDAGFGAGRADIGAAVRLLSADGDTPTAEALRAAAADLRASGYTSRSVIVLVSDGESNCDGDPCEVSKQIRAELGIDVTVNTVGFQISDEGRNELQCIADATGGDYVDAGNADELIDSLQSLAAAALTLDIDAPNVAIRSVGIGETDGRTPDVVISTTIRNTSSNLAGNVRATVTVTSERQPFILRPVRTVGNIEPSKTREVVWTFTPPLDFSDVDITLLVAVTAINAPPVEREVTVSLRGSIRLQDGGDILQGRENVVILGDSYSSGEGTRNYLPGTDTAQNACHRSAQTYGADLWPNRTVIACSGATTHHFYNEQYKGLGTQLEQLRAVQRTEPVDLVLMTLGGNDAQFGGLIAKCLAIDCDDADVVVEVPCGSADAVVLPDDARFLAPATGCARVKYSISEHHRRLLTDVVPRLVDVYREVDWIVNPDAAFRPEQAVTPILVLAYPSPIPDGRRFAEVVPSCTANISLDYDEWRYAVEFASEMNAAVRTAVQQARDRGVPVYFVEDSADAFEPSHTVCDGDPYLNPFDVAAGGTKLAGIIARVLSVATVGRVPLLFVFAEETPAEREFKASFHPNADGYRAMTAALVEWSATEAAEQPPPARRRAEPFVPRPDPTLELIWDVLDGPPPLQPGTNTILFLQGLQGAQPGSHAGLFLESELTYLGNSYIGEGGTARFDVVVPADLELGDHTLTLIALSDTGDPLTQVLTIEAEPERTRWERWSPVAAGASGVTALVGLLSFLVLVALRRRSEPRHAPL